MSYFVPFPLFFSSFGEIEYFSYSIFSSINSEVICHYFYSFSNSLEIITLILTYCILKLTNVFAQYLWQWVSISIMSFFLSILFCHVFYCNIVLPSPLTDYYSLKYIYLVFIIQSLVQKVKTHYERVSSIKNSFSYHWLQPASSPTSLLPTQIFVIFWCSLVFTQTA